MTAPSRDTPLSLAVVFSATVDEYVATLDVTRDGTLGAVGTAAGELCVFDLESASVRFRKAAHHGGILASSWSARHRTLATSGHDGLIRLHDVNGREIGCLSSSGLAEHVAWSPSGEHLAAASGRVVRVWSASGAMLLETEPHEGAITAIAWNRRGTELATASYGGVRFFEPTSSISTRHLRWSAPFISLTWSPDDAIIASGTQENSVHIWRLASARDAEMAGFPAKPRALAWDSESSMLATSGDSNVAVWMFDGKGPEGRPPVLLVGHRALCTVVAFHPKRPRLASGADDTHVILWDPRGRTTPLATGVLEETVTGLAWGLGGRLLLGVDARGTVRAWSTE